jgi:hypothetical protein
MADVKTISSVYRHLSEHPFTKEAIRFDWDYVLAGYGTGAVMGSMWR